MLARVVDLRPSEDDGAGMSMNGSSGRGKTAMLRSRRRRSGCCLGGADAMLLGIGA
jgi:hypothetical protein